MAAVHKPASTSWCRMLRVSLFLSVARCGTVKGVCSASCLSRVAKFSPSNSLSPGGEGKWSKAAWDPGGLSYGLSQRGKLYGYSLSQEKLSSEWINPYCSKIILLPEQLFVPCEKNPEHLYAHGFFLGKKPLPEETECLYVVFIWSIMILFVLTIFSLITSLNFRQTEDVKWL